MKPTNLLIVLDGWGYREETAFNAIAQAHTPTWDRLCRVCPTALLECSGEHVGLPHGQMGNSEVGHITLGAGRVVYQELTRINRAIETGEFAKNSVIQALLQSNRSNAIHVLGLLSPGGVHSHEHHIFALLELCATAGREVILHAFLDGRDMPPQSASESIHTALAMTEKIPNQSLASITGRYYAMDRDQRWQRTQQAYDLLTLGQTQHPATNALEGLATAYDRGETDEFVAPTRIGPARPIQNGDDVVFMNFRADRARQLSRALVCDDVPDAMQRKSRPRVNRFISLTPYAEDIANGGSSVDEVQVIFDVDVLKETLGETLAKVGKTQLRIAETEKYAHVTYFFSGGTEQHSDGETRCLLPSPKVATYDLKPEMSAYEVT